MKAYIGTKIIMAEPAEDLGVAGYRVIYPDGYASWSPKETFDAAYREISRHERQLLDQTDAEHRVMAISDGDPDQPDGVCESHSWEFNEEHDDWRCIRCGDFQAELASEEGD